MYLLNRICVDDKEIHGTMYSKFHTLCGAHCRRALMPSASGHHCLHSIAAARTRCKNLASSRVSGCLKVGGVTRPMCALRRAF